MSEVAPVEPVRVSTPKDLAYAISREIKHVIITEHLDLTILPLEINAICEEGCSSPIPVITHTESIRGDCASPPTEEELAVLAESPGAVAMLPFQDRQCLMLTNEDTLPTLSEHLWLDNVYIRMLFRNLPDERAWLYPSLVGLVNLPGEREGRGAYYITRSTFQGDGLGPIVGLWVGEAVYIENCTFANLGGSDTVGCTECSSAINIGAISATVVNSTFFDPTPAPGATYLRISDNARVLLSDCEFSPASRGANAESPLFANESAAIYSTDLGMSFRSDTDSIALTWPLPQAEEDHPNTSSTRFLRRDDPWFLRIRSLLNVTLPRQPPYPAPTEPVPLLDTAARNGVVTQDISSGSEGGSGVTAVGVIIGGCLTALAVVLIACGVVFTLRRRRKAAKSAATDTAGYQVSTESTPAPVTQSGGTCELNVTVGSDASSRVGAKGKKQRQKRVQKAEPLQQQHLSQHELMALVNSQLDTFGPEAIIFEQFKLLGAPHRIQGSKSVVAMAVLVHADVPFALKFFPVVAQFKAELAVRKTPLAAFTPQIYLTHDPAGSDPNHACTWDCYGRPLPPCIVMPRGESLQAWLDRAETDCFQAVSVLSHIAEALRDIHAMNCVHGHVKPAHILHLRQGNRWTLTDFDRAASVGCPVPPVATLEYTSPENMHAAASGAEAVHASPAADCWALGVVAFELLTNAKALKPSCDGATAVEAQLLGHAELPWEGGRLDAATMRCLGVLHNLVLGLLRRDPAQRSTMSAFCSACLAIVASNTTTAGQM